MKKIYTLLALSIVVSMSIFSVSAATQSGGEMPTEIVQSVDEGINATDKHPGGCPGKHHDRCPGERHDKCPGEHQDKFPGKHHDKCPGERQDKCPGEHQDKCPGERQDKFPGEHQDKCPGEHQDKCPGKHQGKCVDETLVAAESTTNENTTVDTQTENNESATSDSTEASVPTAADPASGENTTTDDQTENSVVNDAIAEYQSAIDSLAADISAAPPSADHISKYKEFSNYKMQLEKIEDSLDFYEDQLEYDLMVGNLDMHSFAAKMIQVEKMENQLDALEDQLEIKYGIDD